MNLNPLKKDNSNTDALVKALADANTLDQPGNPAEQPAAGSGPTADPMPDPATIAADPLLAGEATGDNRGVETEPAVDGATQVTDTPATDTGSNDSEEQPTSEPELPKEAPKSESTNASADNSSGITFDGNDLPAGMSSDAEAHLETPSTTPSSGSGANGDLEEVKKSALDQLRPLIEKLDLTPEDKFDKYLMMLRASDDPTLIKPAFKAAEGITGEKEKAQAMLDIINEINYITASSQPTS